jgi:hypothetical protein
MDERITERPGDPEDRITDRPQEPQDDITDKLPGAGGWPRGFRRAGEESRKVSPWFPVLVIGSVLAIPLAVIATCAVVPPTRPPFAAGAAAVCIGVPIGIPLTVLLAWWAVILWRKKPDNPEPPD